MAQGTFKQLEKKLYFRYGIILHQVPRFLERDPDTLLSWNEREIEQDIEYGDNLEVYAGRNKPVSFSYRFTRGRGRRASYFERTAKEIDEELRKKLRKNNKDGFLMAEEGDLVGVHLNKNKFPFFNIKKPRYQKKHKGIYPSQTLGHVRALVLDDVWFYVGSSGVGRVTFSNKTTKEPYAGVNGFLSAVELPSRDDVYGDSFNEVPNKAGKQVFFNPRDRDLKNDIFKMHNFFFVDSNNRPVKSASRVVMRDWGVYADGLVYMSDSEIDGFLDLFDLTQDEVEKDLSGFFKKRASGNQVTWLA